MSSEIEKIGFVSLGCPKNLVDSEVMMGQLKQHGYELTTDREAAEPCHQVFPHIQHIEVRHGACPFAACQSPIHSRGRTSPAPGNLCC